MKSLLRHSQYI